MADSKENAFRLYAQVSSAWNVVEYNMAVLLAELLGTRVPLALTVLATVSSVSLRREIVQNVAINVLVRKTDIAKVKKLMDRVAAAARTRVGLVHGMLLESSPEDVAESLVLLNIRSGGTMGCCLRPSSTVPVSSGSFGRCTC